MVDRELEADNMRFTIYTVIVYNAYKRYKVNNVNNKMRYRVLL